MNEWDNIPSVQKTRKIFSIMERIDGELIKAGAISKFDPKLRHIRDESRKLFEKSFLTMRSKGISLDEGLTIALFRQCHIMAYRNSGIDLPDFKEPDDLIKEALK